jgi:hypothetical protein
MTRHPVCGCELQLYAASRAERRAARRLGHAGATAVTLHQPGCPVGIRATGSTRPGIHNASTKSTRGRK